MSGRDEDADAVDQFLADTGCPRVPITASADVELKLAMRMRREGQTDTRMRNVTVVLNNRPCRGMLSCDQLIGVVLPPGYSLTVHAPGGWTKTYPGGGAKPW